MRVMRPKCHSNLTPACSAWAVSRASGPVPLSCVPFSTFELFLANGPPLSRPSLGFFRLAHDRRTRRRVQSPIGFRLRRRDIERRVLAFPARPSYAGPDNIVAPCSRRELGPIGGRYDPPDGCNG